MHSKAGKEAFRKLVFRINANLKRRGRERKTPRTQKRLSIPVHSNVDINTEGSDNSVDRRDSRKKSIETTSPSVSKGDFYHVKGEEPI
jgi:hypothetical protein